LAFLKQDDGPYRNQDETVEVAVNLNLDPRKPGQALRGSLTLPNGTGKKISCVVFTANAELAQKCLEQGALHAGGEELVDKVLAGEIPVDSFQRTLATQEIMGAVSKQLARLLGPRGLMPSPKLSTVFKSPEELLTSLEQQAKNVTYRTESSGIVHVPVGKGSFSNEQLLENIQSVFQTLQEVKPDFYGKGKKSSKKVGKNVKYFLKAHLSSSQGEGVKVDLRTVDPSSPFFMGDPEAA
jgi:large subunit ribosomal protein L1